MPVSTVAAQQVMKPAMGVLEFIASITSSVTALLGSLAWPGLLLAVVFLFRPQLLALFTKLSSFEGWGVKVQFGEEVSALAAAAEQPTQDPPNPDHGEIVPPPAPSEGGFGSGEGKVVAAWLTIERALRNAAAEHDMSTRGRKMIELADELGREGVLSSETVALVEEARRLRNAVVHGQASGFSFLTAQQYTFTAKQIVARIEQDASRPH